MNSDITIQLSYGDRDLARIRELRYEVLRKPLGMPFSSTLFPGDESQSTLHLLAIRQSEVTNGVASMAQMVGVASLLIEESDSIQLRGMAVAPNLQRGGVGRKIVQEAKQIAMERNRSLWCNARLAAIGFYEGQGWVVSGDFFDIPVVGKHIVMKWSGNEKITDGTVI